MDDTSKSGPMNRPDRPGPWGDYALRLEQEDNRTLDQKNADCEHDQRRAAISQRQAAISPEFVEMARDWRAYEDRLRQEDEQDAPRMVRAGLMANAKFSLERARYRRRRVAITDAFLAEIKRAQG